MAKAILKTFQRIFTLTGLCVRIGENDRRTNIRQIMVYCIILVLYFLFELASIVYVVRHLRMGDVENCLYAGFQVVAILSTIGTFLTVGYRKRKVRNIIDEFQQIVDSSKYCATRILR